MADQQSEGGISPSTRAHDLAHVEQLFERLGLRRVVRPMPPLALWATYVFVNGFLSIALLALLAMATGVPFVFPSLGPTAYQLFFLPRSASSTPRNALIGHFIGLVCGYAAFRMAKIPVSVALATGSFDLRPVLASALSLSATAAIMILLDASHPPAGATTLIVSMGIITRPLYLAMIELAVFALIVASILYSQAGPATLSDLEGATAAPGVNVHLFDALEYTAHMARELTLRIVIEQPPAGVEFALQKGSGSDWEAVQKQHSQGKDLVFEFQPSIRDGVSDSMAALGGPFIQGPRRQRFVYIGIGTYAGQADSSWSRRLKIPLDGIPAKFIVAGGTLEARAPGTGRDGGPNCATVKDFEGWKAV